jgi:imidazolonepropionase-like amidohydrolase
MTPSSRVLLPSVLLSACPTGNGGGAPPADTAPPVARDAGVSASGTPAPAASRGAPAKRLLLHPARIVDVRRGVYVGDVGVLIDAGRIVEASAYDDLARREADTPVIELPGITLLPGLIDCHTHLLTSFRPHVGEDDAVLLSIATMSTAERALLGARNAREVLEGGITTVRDVGNSGLAGDVALARAIEAGWVRGPRMVPTTRALAPSGGQLPIGMNPAVAGELVAQEYAVVSGPEGVRRGVREAIAAGARAIKLIGDANGNSLHVEELRAAVDEARPRHIKVAVDRARLRRRRRRPRAHARQPDLPRPDGPSSGQPPARHALRRRRAGG